jgi:hypothetical protein
MRSVPPTSLPFATLKPDQTRNLPTRLASLSAPAADDPNSTVSLPAKGEKLRLGDIHDQSNDPRVLQALERLARDKAPETIASLVMWNVAAGLDWEEIAKRSAAWANDYELTLARTFVDRLGQLPEGESGTLFYDLKATGASAEELSGALAEVLKGRTVLGLNAQAGVPAAPEGPALGCQIAVRGGEATVSVAKSDREGRSWERAGKFTIPVALKDGKFDALKFADAMAEGLIGRLVRAQINKAGRVKGKDVYKVRIDNASPLLLNGLAILGGAPGKAEETPKVLSGISLSPGKHMEVPATAEVVLGLGLRRGVRVVAADLSGL